MPNKTIKHKLIDGVEYVQESMRYDCARCVAGDIPGTLCDDLEPTARCTGFWKIAKTQF